MIFEVMSGGQTGVDIAALKAAEAFALPISGHVPKNYTNETGSHGIPARFRPFLEETSSTASAERTRLNIESADGILTLLQGESEASEISKGTQLGLDHAKELKKRSDQLCSVDLRGGDVEAETERVLQWITANRIDKCLIGGPRESEAPGIEASALAFLKRLFEKLVAARSINPDK